MYVGPPLIPTVPPNQGTPPGLQHCNPFRHLVLIITASGHTLSTLYREYMMVISHPQTSTAAGAVSRSVTVPNINLALLFPIQ